jgi:hypothetical protein
MRGQYATAEFRMLLITQLALILALCTLLARVAQRVVVMTFVTTLMTSPLLTWLGTGRRRTRGGGSQLQYR